MVVPPQSLAGFLLKLLDCLGQNTNFLVLTGGRVVTSPSLAELRHSSLFIWTAGYSSRVSKRVHKRNALIPCALSYCAVHGTESPNLSTNWQSLIFSVWNSADNTFVLLPVHSVKWKSLWLKQWGPKTKMAKNNLLHLWGQISCWTFFSHLAHSKRQKNRDIIDLPLFKFNYLSPNLTSTWAEHYLTMQKVPAASLVLAKKRETLNNLYLVSDFSFLMHF